MENPDRSAVLVLDTAMNGCSAGVWHEGTGVLAARTVPMPRGQAEALVPMIEDVLAQAALSYNDIGMIAVTRGPGAFTGLRIGLATARALSLALGIPVCGVSTFDALLRTGFESPAFQAREYYGVLIETKRDDFYFRLFDAQAQVCSPALAATAADILPFIEGRNIVLTGDALERFLTQVPDLKGVESVPVDLPSISAIAHVAAGTPEEEYTAEPLYIRPPDVTLPQKDVPGSPK